MEEHDNMDYFYQQVVQKDVTRRLQVGQDLIDYLNDPQRSPDVEQDKPRLDKTVDELTGWVNSSNFKVRDNGLSSYKGIALSLKHSPSRPFHELFSTSLGQGEVTEISSSAPEIGINANLREIKTFQTSCHRLSGMKSPF